MLARLLLLLVCAVGVPAVAATWQQPSDRGAFIVTVAPLDGDIAIGRFQQWQLTITHAGDDRAVRDATVLVGGGMRAHGHGLPSQPRVVQQMRAGSYLIEGLRFNMAGEWVLALSIDSAEARDRVLFDITVAQPQVMAAPALAALAISDTWQAPPAPSNRFANDAAAATLGERLFFDAALSGDGSISCASCHDPDQAFTDGRRFGQGLGRAMRNTPSLLGVAENDWFYWDGRRDSLWSQALVPFEAEDEMGSSRVAVVRHVATTVSYRHEYEAVFGALPQLAIAQWPEHAGAIGGAASKEAWFRLSRRQQTAINGVFANIGKAIAAYERTLKPPVTKFDQHATAGAAQHKHDASVLTDDERAGLALFLDADKTHCLRCHNGRMFTNQGFHNIGTGNFSGDRLDFGRVYGLQSAVRDGFNCLGPFSDAATGDCESLEFLSKNSHVPLEGAFKVPTLRGLTQTAPYMHDGRFATIEAVIEHYRHPPTDGPQHELQPLALTDAEAVQLAAFLRTLSAPAIGRVVEHAH